MNAILRRNVSDRAAGNAKPDKSGVNFFGVGFGEGFEVAFAISVMLGALWLLVSGFA